MKRKIFQVYTVTNKITGAIYVAYTLSGLTKQNSRYFTTNKALYDDMMQFGVSSFKKYAIKNFSTRDDAQRCYRNLLIKLKSSGKMLYNDLCSYGYVYMTTNNLNGMKYIGQHRITGNPRKDDMYFGSGTVIYRVIKKYGKENFSKEILEECRDEDTLNSREQFWIEKYDAVNNPNFYNIAKGGSFGDTWTGRSRKQKRAFSKAIAESNRKRKRDGSKMAGENNPSFGKHWYKDLINKVQYYLHSEDPLIQQLNLVPGLFRTKKHNKKIGDANRGKKKDYVVFAKGKVVVNDGKMDKFIKKGEVDKYLSQGFNLGRRKRTTHKVRMNDGNRNFLVSAKQVRRYLAQGCALGWMINKS